MMEAERAYETLECSSILNRLVAREDFIATTILGYYYYYYYYYYYCYYYYYYYC
jgi:hypothetical protein